jgi:protein TonB
VPPEPEGETRRERLERVGLAVVAAALLASIVVALLLLRPRPARKTATASPDTIGFVTADATPLKKSPSISAETVGTLPAGTRLTLKGEDGRWFDVATEKGVRGFVSAEAVERQTERETRERRAKVIAGFAPVFGLVAEDTGVRLAPFPQAPTSGRLTRGTVIAIYSVDHDFYGFKTSKGDIAFVASADVDLVPTDPSKPEIRPGQEKAPRDLTVTGSSAPPPEQEAEGEPAAQPAVPAQAPAPPPPPVSADGIEPAVLASRVEPVYPEGARRAGIQGLVELEVVISAEGRVSSVEVVRGLPFGLSDSAASAVRRWKYVPARGKNGPVASRKTVRILFQLEH